MAAVLPFIPLIASGLGFAGGMVKNKSQSTTTPTMDPAYGPLQKQILDMVTKRLGANTDLSGYAATGQQNVNRTFDTIKQSQDNNLTARGLGTSPVAGVVDANREAARAGQMSSFLNTLPLVRRQMETENLGLGRDVLGLGRGQTTQGESGGGLGGGLENLAQMLGYFAGKGAFGKPGTGPYGGPGTPGYPGDTPYWPTNDPLTAHYG